MEHNLGWSWRGDAQGTRSEKKNFEVAVKVKEQPVHKTASAVKYDESVDVSGEKNQTSC